MLTRIYTPPVMPYHHAQAGGAASVDQSDAADQSELLENPRRGLRQEAGTTLQAGVRAEAPAAGETRRLNSLQEHSERQTIGMATILKDFESTLNALGVDETTHQEVSAYLHVAALQASKPQPEVGFIRHALKTAAGTMDRYISDALKQPSHVVKDWVDALLLQKIDFQLNAPPSPLNASIQDPIAQTAANSDIAADTAASAPAAATLGGSAEQQIKHCLQQGRQAFDGGDLGAARAALTQARNLVDQASTPMPGLRGRVYHALGKLADSQYQYGEAIGHYQVAARAFEKAGNTAKQSQAMYALGGLYEDQGQLDSARQAYETVLRLETQGDTATWKHASLGKTYNHLGSIHLRQDDPVRATEAFLLAYQHARQAAGDSRYPQEERAQDITAILSNLARAEQDQGHVQQAIRAYKLSLKAARDARDPVAYRDGLTQLHHLFEDLNDRESLVKIQDKLARLDRQLDGQFAQNAA